MHLLAHLETFVETAKLRNFGRAAQVMGITPPTLSRRIAALERDLGVVLIRRSTRSFALTEAGQKLLDRSEPLIEHTSRIREELSAGFTKVAGHLRVGAPSDLAISLAAPIFAEYCHANEQTSIDIVTTQGQPDLLRDRLDIAFAVTHQARLPDSSYSARQIGSFPRLLFASKAYLRRHGNPKTPHEIQQHHCIRHLSGSPEAHWDLHRGRKRETVTVNGICASSSVVASAHAAREHLGIVMLPLHLARHPAYGSGLVQVLPEWEGTPVVIFAVTADRVLPARTEELIRVAKTQFAKRLAELESVAG